MMSRIQWMRGAKAESTSKIALKKKATNFNSGSDSKRIGKEKVIKHHQEVPFRVLERQYRSKTISTLRITAAKI